MLRRVARTALLVAALAAAPASAVETMRISMGDAAGPVRVAGPGLALGEDAEDAELGPAPAAAVVLRAEAGQLLVDGVRWQGTSARFRATGGAPDAGAPGGVPLQAGTHTVRGDVVARAVGGRVQLVNVIPLEDYLAAVLGSEMPRSFPLEALKAQAVAARTYALHKKIESYGSPFHMGSSVLHQVYGGVDREDARTRAAVEATRGEVLTWQLAPIEAYFHASCGGRTETGQDALGRALPYLQAVACPCGGLKQTRWSARVPRADVAAAVKGSPDGLRVSARSSTGRASRLSTRAGSSVDGVSFRQRLGYTRLKSLDFQLRADGSAFVFEGRGYGHGAGLCQWGAKALADAGRSYREIVAHYYPGTELQTLY